MTQKTADVPVRKSLKASEIGPFYGFHSGQTKFLFLKFVFLPMKT